MADKSNKPAIEALGDFLVSRQADQFAFLSALVRVNSENPPGNRGAMTAKLVELLEHLELSANLEPPPNDTDAKNENKGPGAPVPQFLTIDMAFGDKPDSGPKIALATHTDTPPAGSGWTRDPQGAEIEDGQIYGLGVSDGKGDLAAYVFAVLALHKCSAGLNGRVQLRISLDSRDNLPGLRADFAILPGASKAIGTTATGVLTFEVEINDINIPVSVPNAGAGVVEASAKVLAALYDHRDTLSKRSSDVVGIGAPTLVVPRIQGGEGALTVPNQAKLTIYRRLLPEEDAAQVVSEITNVVGRAVVAIPGVVCKVRRLCHLPAIVPNDAVEPLLDVLRREGEQVVGEPLATYGTACETPARLYAGAGVPVVMYGTGAAASKECAAARADEALDLDDVRVATQVLTMTLANLLSSTDTDDTV